MTDYITNVTIDGTQVNIKDAETSNNLKAHVNANNPHHIQVGGRNLLIVSKSKEGYIYSGNGGELKELENQAAMLEYISVTPGEKLTFSRKAGSGDIFRIIHYDTDKNFISRHPLQEIASGSEGSYVYTVPNNVYYIRVSYPYDGTSEAKLERGNIATDWTPAPEDLKTTAITNAKIDSICQ